MVAHHKTSSGARSKHSAKSGGQAGHPLRARATRARKNSLPAWLTCIPRRVHRTGRFNLLPYRRRQEIAAYAENHTLVETAAWLKAAGISARVASISVFLSHFALQERLKYTLPVLQDLLVNLQAQNPALNADDLDKIGRFLFASLETWKAKNALPGGAQ